MGVSSRSYRIHASFLGVEAFAKVGVGSTIKRTIQVGAKYNVFPGIDIHAYYERNKLESHKNINGYNIGVGFAF